MPRAFFILYTVFMGETEMEDKIQTRQEKRELRLRKQIKKEKIIRWSLIGIGILLLIGSLFLIFSGKEKPKPYEALSAEIAEDARNRQHIDPERAVIVDAGLSLLGKVNYFWGGKSDAVGFDPRFGVLTEVTSKGSETSGTMRPYGLDCSGFVSWCFIQSGMTEVEMAERIGRGTWNQWEKSAAIEWDELMPGDLVFQNEYPEATENHVGICIGFDEEGEPLFVHCAASFDNVVVTYAGDIFRFARRPSVF